MVDAERASSLNALWLCRDCHGQVDRDEGRFPAELLFKWKELHERKILAQLGKPGDLARAEMEDEALRDFRHFPGIIRQLVRERPDYWEYLLTAELLTHYLPPILRRGRDLQHGAYALRSTPISDEEFIRRFRAWTSDLSHAVRALDRVVNFEIPSSWGPPGKPGVPLDIKHACELYAAGADRLVSVAEEVKFTGVSDSFQPVRDLFVDGAMYCVPRLASPAEFLRGVFAGGDPAGTYQFNLVIELPPRWDKEVAKALRNATRTGWW